MSKYNNIKSIPIDSLSDEELKIAMKEWAEGDDSMEELLWAFYNKGIITSGCHAGAGSYVSMDYDVDKKEEFSLIMNTVLSFPGSQILIRPDGGNPFSGRDWYKPDIGVGFDYLYKDETDDTLDKITKVINGEDKIPSELDLSPIHDLCNFFINKYIGVSFRIKQGHDKNYMFSVECKAKEDSEKYNFFNDYLSSLGYNLSSLEDIDRRFWKYKTNNVQEFNDIVKKTSDLLINNFSLKIPDNPEEVDEFNIKAHLIRNKSEEEFEKWLILEDQKSKDAERKRMQQKK